MPQIADVTIQDGTSPTPVTHTFNPTKTTADYALWEDREHNGGIYVGNMKLAMSLSRPTGNSNMGNRNLKLVMRLETPVLEVVGNSAAGITPPPQVAFRPIAELVMTLPERMTKQQRTDLRALMRSAMGHSAFIGAVDDLALPY